MNCLRRHAARSLKINRSEWEYERYSWTDWVTDWVSYISGLS